MSTFRLADEIQCVKFLIMSQYLILLNNFSNAHSFWRVNLSWHDIVYYLSDFGSFVTRHYIYIYIGMARGLKYLGNLVNRL
jgi:hypothetical protein